MEQPPSYPPDPSYPPAGGQPPYASDPSYPPASGGQPAGLPPGSGSGTRPVALIVVLVVLLVGIAVGGVLLLSGGDGDDGGGGDETAGSTTTGPTGDGSGGDGSGGDGDGDGGSGSPEASLTGTWEGTYECGGTVSGLTLTIDDPADGTVGANFAFHPTEENPGAPSGRYSMEGTVGDGQLTLEGSHWIAPEESATDDPMPGIEADLGDRADPERLEGTVVGDGCTGFSVERTSTDPWYAGVWEGVYGCAQGLTGLRLTIEPERDGMVEATYEFYAPPENPDVPSGSYAMEGTYDDQRELSLHGVEWIEQPDGYVMVDLLFIAELGVDPQRLYGAITDTQDSCSIFNLNRPTD